MQLSVVIVNYNVKHFLDQCLQSVYKAGKHLHMEVFVVDNASIDGSVDMIKTKYPQTIVIANADNPGFSKANNQAILQAQGEFILLLNPDTLVNENTFEICIQFMAKHPDGGALGCKLIDGTGNILPESKRGFPTISTSFFKLTGLYKLFPNHKVINHYYLGDRSYNENGYAEILTGAFFFMRKSAQEKVGLLDEQFFMYGEDIDYSYRFAQAGYKIYYVADTQIIHYKGESTKKGSLNYVRVFYQAMILFARKHFTGSKAGSYIFFLQIAIYIKACITVIQNTMAKVAKPVVDAMVLMIGLYTMQQVWAIAIMKNPTYYDNAMQMWINAPLYTLVWVLCLYVSGVYDNRNTLYRIMRGIIAGFIINAAIYSFFPLHLRSSRALLLLGGLWALIFVPLVHFILHYFTHKNITLGYQTKKRIALVANNDEAFRITTLLRQLDANTQIIGTINNEIVQNQHIEKLGNTANISDLVRFFKINEIIFSANDFSNNAIMQWMTDIGAQVNFKIVPPESQSIIGSNSKNTAGDLLAFDIHFNIAQSHNVRNKRLFDVFAGVILLTFSPIFIWFQHNKINFIKSIIEVLSSKKTWVGYNNTQAGDIVGLPKIKNAVYAIHSAISGISTQQVNTQYAKEYSVEMDFQTVMKHLF